MIGEINWGALTFMSTVVVEILAAGIFVGVTRTTLTEIRRELNEHKDRDALQGHGCPFILAGHREDLS